MLNTLSYTNHRPIIALLAAVTALLLSAIVACGGDPAQEQGATAITSQASPAAETATNRSAG